MKGRKWGRRLPRQGGRGAGVSKGNIRASSRRLLRLIEVAGAGQGVSKGNRTEGTEGTDVRQCPGGGSRRGGFFGGKLFFRFCPHTRLCGNGLGAEFVFFRPPRGVGKSRPAIPGRRETADGNNPQGLRGFSAEGGWAVPPETAPEKPKNPPRRFGPKLFLRLTTFLLQRKARIH